MNTPSKTKELVTAARNRVEANRQAEEEAKVATSPHLDDQSAETEGLKERAEAQLETIVQYRAGAIDGHIDIEAMGDVKGDGGDAVEYADGDPDKALGVPVYVHGLNRTKVGGDFVGEGEVTGEKKHSSRTAAELARGREVLEARVPVDAERRRASSGKTVVTDTETDADGEEGARLAEEARLKAEKEEEGRKADEDRRKAEARRKAGAKPA